MLTKKEMESQNTEFDFGLKFFGHYEEPNLSFKVSRELLVANEGMLKIELVFNPFRGNGQWERVTGFNFFSS